MTGTLDRAATMKFSAWSSIVAAAFGGILILAVWSISDLGGFALPNANTAFLTAWLDRADRASKIQEEIKTSGNHNADQHIIPPVEAPAPTEAAAAAGSQGSLPPTGSIGGDSCDIYTGRWVRDDEYPLFQPFLCPFTDGAFQCQENGRNDSSYLHWRWQPHGCDLPRFNATDMLEKLRGRRLAFIGDSLGRNQWESLVCMLYQALSNKTSIYEARGSEIGKSGDHYSIVFRDHNVKIDFYRSRFLVGESWRLPSKANKKIRAPTCTLTLDRVNQAAREWRKADILVFNSGHWWEHHNVNNGECYFIQGSNYTATMDTLAAFETSMGTWSRWIDRHITTTQRVFFRGYSPNHFSGGDWDTGGSCLSHLEPLADESKLDKFPNKVEVVERVLRRMKTPVTLLNVTKLSLFRKDAHVARWGRKNGWDHQDCSHWCLPGIPDTWNQLLYASMTQ